MALITRELLSDADGYRGGPAIQIEKNKVGTLATQSGSPVLPRATPLAYDSVNDIWTVYTQPSDAGIYTLTNGSTGIDGGSLDLSIDGVVTQLAWNVTAAAAQTAINAALIDAGKLYTVAAAATAQANLGVAAAIITLTMSEDAGAPTVSIDTGLLTDGGLFEPTGVTFGVTDAGTQLNDTNKIRGFVDDDGGVLSDATDEVQCLVALVGDLSRDAINTTAIRLVLGGSPSEAELDIALQSQDLRALGFQIKDLIEVS